MNKELISCAEQLQAEIEKYENMKKAIEQAGTSLNDWPVISGLDFDEEPTPAVIMAKIDAKLKILKGNDAKSIDMRYLSNKEGR